MNIEAEGEIMRLKRRKKMMRRSMTYLIILIITVLLLFIRINKHDTNRQHPYIYCKKRQLTISTFNFQLLTPNS